jgi:hypothetical protein
LIIPLGKLYVKKNLQLRPGLLNVHLLKNSSFGTKDKGFKYSTYMEKEKEIIVDHVTYSDKLNVFKYPLFLLLQEMFQHKGISMINTYLCRFTELTLKNYKSGWKKVTLAFLNIICTSISKLLTVSIPDFNFAQSNFVKNIKKGLIKDNPKKPRYSNIWNSDLLLDYYLNINIEKINNKNKFQFLHTK